MAKPAGAITPSDGGYAATTSPGASYSILSFPNPFSPMAWMTSDPPNSKYKIQISHCHTIGAATDMGDSARFYNDTSILPTLTHTISGAVNAQWADHTTDGFGPFSGINCNEPSLGTPSTLPHRMKVRVKWDKDAATTTEMLGYSIELEHGDAYTDTPITERYIELIDRTTIRTYSADYPATAWHAQWVLCHTMNRIEYCAPQCWSVPL